jgi:alkanesulfonate monooxygenase SsuD/methylene tetrahydromethanopterin reductase-like flavin-dependent oxidoreductase (luciferase family)
MHVGLVMECDYREGRTQEEAFAEAMDIAEIAETQGLDGVWLAERHFAMHRRPTDPMGAGIPSIASVPLVLAAAIAARTSRLRIGTGVSVLPLCHPIRTAEEAATVDQISQGRLDFGVGRSGFPRALRWLWHSLRREPRAFPGITRRHSQGVDTGRFLAHGEILHVRQADRRAAPLSEAAPADLGGGHHPRHVSHGRPHGVLAGHGPARL